MWWSDFVANYQEQSMRYYHIFETKSQINLYLNNIISEHITQPPIKLNESNDKFMSSTQKISMQAPQTLTEQIDQFEDLIFQLQLDQCDQIHAPQTKYVPSDVQYSSTLSVAEILSGERTFPMPAFPATDNDFYEECIKEANLGQGALLPIMHVGKNDQMIRFDSTQMDAFKKILENSLFLSLQPDIVVQINEFIDNIKIPQYIGSQSVFALISQQVTKNDVQNILLRNETQFYQFLTCPTADSLLDTIRLFNLQVMWEQQQQQRENDMQDVKNQLLQVFSTDLIQDDQFFQQSTVNESILTGQLALACLLTYFYDSDFVQRIHQFNLAPSMINAELNPHCLPNFEFTDLPHVTETYKKVRTTDYNRETHPDAIYEPVLQPAPYLISNAGNVFRLNPTSLEFVYDQRARQQPQIAHEAQIKEDEQVVKQVESAPAVVAEKVTHLTPLDPATVTVQLIQTVGLTMHGFYTPSTQPSMQLEQLRNKCRNVLKMVQLCRKNIIRRYRVNKNANQINSECTRSKKIITDYEQLKKKIQNEGRSVKMRKWPMQRKAKSDAQLEQNPEVTSTINLRLDETEALVKEKCVGLYELETETENKSDLKIKILDQPETFNGVLKHYQKQGFSWLVSMFNQRLNPLLCDQMGLGKTIQVIAFFLHLMETTQAGPFLVVCPNSLLNNWVSEMKRFAEVLNVWPYWGNVQQRQSIRSALQHLIYCHGQPESTLNEDEIFGAKQCPMHVMVTSYSLAVQDFKHLSRVPWLSIVLDEGQMIKSSETKRWHAMMQYKTQNKVLLSGTPVQNSLDELWSLLHFVMPDVFKSKENFADWFGRDIEQAAVTGLRLNVEQLTRLHLILQPFVLRREKKEVASQLGEKIERELMCQMTAMQAKVYKQVKTQANLGELLQNGREEELNNIIMQLRKVVNHPQIFGKNVVQLPVVLKTEQKRPIFVTEDDDFDDGISAVTTLNKSELEIQPKGISITLEGQLVVGPPKQALKAKLAKPANQLLTDIVTTISRLYEHGSEHSRRETQIVNGIRMDQGLFEYAFPLLIVQLIESFDYDRRFDVLDSLKPVFDIFKCDITVFKCCYAIATSLCRNGDFSKHPWYTGYKTSMQLFKLLKMMYAQDSDESCLRSLNMWSIEQRNTIDDQKYLNVNFMKGLRSLIPNTITTKCSFRKFKAINFPPILSGGYAKLRATRIPEQLVYRYSFLYYGGLDQLLEESGKLQMLDRLLTYLFNQKQICLVYCQMTRMMDVLEDYLSFRGFKFVRLDGSMSVAERKLVVDRFMTDPTIFVFLLSTRAGSLGLNLTRASNVVFYESDWNPTSDAQASDRVHRIGQTKDVQIWKIIGQNTVDERIIRRAEEKSRLQKLVLNGQQRDQFGNLVKRQSTRDVLAELLREE